MRSPRAPKRNRYELHYARIEELLGQPLADLQVENVYRLRASGFMTLVVEVLPPCEETGGLIVSLCHYYLLNGDLCQDPEMTVRLFPPGSMAFRGMIPSTSLRQGRAEALTYQTAIPPVYQEVYPEPGVYRPRLRSELNSFLGLWLRNLRAQGHRLVESRDSFSD